MRITLLLLLTLFLSTPLFSQPSEGAEGVILFGQGKYEEAARSFRSAVKSKTGKVDAKLWNALGLAETMSGDYKSAIKSLKKATDLNNNEAEYWTNLGYAKLRIRDLKGAHSATDRAIKLNANSALAYYVQGLADLWEDDLSDAQKNYLEIRKRDSKFSNGYILGAWIELAHLQRAISRGASDDMRDHLPALKGVVDTLQTGIDNCVGCTGKEAIFSEYEGMTYFFEHYSKERTSPGTPPPTGVTPLKIISKPRAQYSESARSSNVSGVIRIVALFRPDGKIGHTFILKRIGYGLDENAMRAARSIKFEPKTVDGKPVPAVMTIEYSFSIY